MTAKQREEAKKVAAKMKKKWADMGLNLIIPAFTKNINELKQKVNILEVQCANLNGQVALLMKFMEKHHELRNEGTMILSAIGKVLETHISAMIKEIGEVSEKWPSDDL